MNKGITFFITFILLLSSIQAEEKRDWTKKGEINDNQAAFAKEIGITAIKGEGLGDVIYDATLQTLTNGKITIKISEIKNKNGAIVEALAGGGFRITYTGELTIGGNNFKLQQGQSFTLENDETIRLDKGASLKTSKGTITALSNIKAKLSGNDYDIEGEAEIKTNDGRVINAKDFGLHFVDKIPAKDKITGKRKNNIFLADHNTFALKGFGEISFSVEGLLNTFKSEHQSTLILSEKENDIQISNPADIPINSPTVARSEHEVRVSNTKTKENKKSTAHVRYTKEEGTIHVRFDSSDFGNIGENKKNTDYIISGPPLVVIVDKKPIYLQSVVKDRFKISFLTPSLALEIKKPSPSEQSDGVFSTLSYEKMNAGADIQLKIPRDSLNYLVNLYNDYSGPVDERDEDFTRALLTHPDLSLTSNTHAGTLVRALASGKTREFFIKQAQAAGLSQDSLKIYSDFLDSFKLGHSIQFLPSGKITIFDGNTPIRSISFDPGSTQRLKKYQIDKLFKNPQTFAKLQTTTRELLKG